MSADVQFASFPLLPTDHVPQAKGAGSAASRRSASGSLLAFAAILVVFSLTAPYFLTVGNIGNVLGQSAISGVLAIGLTVVLIAGGSNVVTGGIDLSLAANMGLSAAVYATLIQLGYGDLAAAVAAALLTGLAIGAVNAAAVVLAGIVPLLATLAVMNVVAGLELVLTQNTVVPASTDFLTAVSASDSFGIPILAYVLIGFTALATAIVQYTPLRSEALCRRRVSGCGRVPLACRSSGCLPGLHRQRVLCGGFAGILSVSYLSGSTTGSGESAAARRRHSHCLARFSRAACVPTDSGNTDIGTLHRLPHQRLPALEPAEHARQRRAGSPDPDRCVGHDTAAQAGDLTMSASTFAGRYAAGLATIRPHRWPSSSVFSDLLSRRTDLPHSGQPAEHSGQQFHACSPSSRSP